jgi:Flp pilus assembly CpaE family ATPase
MKNHSETTEQPKSLEQRLNAHPDLKVKIEVLLSVVENAQGDLIRADAAEQRVVEEIRQLGQTALQEWATQQHQQQSEAFRQANPSAHRGGKKTLLA